MSKTPYDEQKWHMFWMNHLQDPVLEELIYRIERHFSDNYPAPAHISGIHLNINTTWFNETPAEEVYPYLEHLMYHMLFMHESRANNFIKANDKTTQEIWSRASDLALALSGVPEYNHPLIFKDTTALHYLEQNNLDAVEIIFRQLQDNNLKNPQLPSGGSGQSNLNGNDDNSTGSGGSSGNEGDNQDQSNGQGNIPVDMAFKSNTPEEQQNLVNQLMDAVTASVTQAIQKNKGNLPSMYRRFIDDLVKPVIDWRTVLKEVMSSKSFDDFSWKRRNRRFHNIYLPSLYSQSPDNIVIVIDVSGSISTEEFNSYMSEVIGLLEDIKPNTIQLIQFDVDIYQTKDINDVDKLYDVEFRGGGGTNFQPVHRLLNTLDYDACVVFTDSYFSMPSSIKLDNPNLFWFIYGTEELCKDSAEYINKNSQYIHIEEAL